MASYKPSVPFAVPMWLLIPSFETAHGVTTATYPDPDQGERFDGSVKTYGGTERDVNGVYSVEDTAVIETWYHPYIKSDCHIYINEMGEFEIISPPEDIDRRHQFLKFKVRRVKGGA